MPASPPTVKQAALHVRPHLWVECSDTAFLLYTSDKADERADVYPALQVRLLMGGKEGRLPRGLSAGEATG